MRHLFRLPLIVVAALAVSSALAGEAEIRRALAPRLADMKIVSVQKLATMDLYEVAVQRNDGTYGILYSDPNGRFLLVGELVEAATDRNLTEERMRKLSAIDWNTLPLQSAITAKRGNGRREIAILSDPNCPYCRRFEADLATVDDITVHILPYAVIKPDSVRQSKAVWCSRDRVKAWNELMQKRIEPEAKPDCDNPVEALIDFGRRLGATGTPTWFLTTGERYVGAMPLDKLLPLLDAAATAKATKRGTSK